MRSIIIATLSIFLFTACSTKEDTTIKNPEMLELNNVNVSFIKGGEFLMGTYEDKFADKPPRRVIVKDFYLDKTEVTNALYKQYMSEAGTQTGVRTPALLNDPLYGADTLPVVGVTHSEAQAFCKYYEKRLPTEAEWEYAAKGDTKNTEYFWGDVADPLYMNFRESKKGMAVAVGSYPPNAYDVFDLNGNVREWVEDSYGRDYYKDACRKKDQTFWGMITGTYDMAKEYFSDDGYIPNTCFYNPVNRKKSKYKVARGGSFDYSKGYPATLSFRFFELRDSTHMDLGFRCASYEKDEDNLIVEGLSDDEEE